MCPRGPEARPELQGHHGQRADFDAAADDFGGRPDARAGYFGGVYRGGRLGRKLQFKKGRQYLLDR